MAGIIRKQGGIGAFGVREANFATEKSGKSYLKVREYVLRLQFKLDYYGSTLLSPIKSKLLFKNRNGFVGQHLN